MKGSTLAFGGGMLAAGLAVGGAVGYLLSSSPVPGVVAPPVSAPPAAKAPSPAPEVRAESPAVPRAASGDRAPLATGSGDGVITGSVVGPDGAPLAGVLLRAEPGEGGPGEEDEEESAHGPPGSPPPRMDIAREVARFSRNLERRQAGLREAETDSAGRFTLAGLPAKGYSIQAWLTGWKIERADGNPWEMVLVGGRCDFKATPIRSVHVSVLLPDGKVPERALITWKPAAGGDGDSAEWKPANPGIEVEPGTYEFVASSGTSGGFIVTGGRLRHSLDNEDDSLYRSEPQTVTVGTGEAQALSFQFVGRPGIQVKVVFASADHPRSVRIAALKLGPGGSAEPARLLEDEKVKADWLTETTEGALVGLEPGTYLVGVTFRGGQVGPTATVAVADRLVTQEIQVPAGEIRESVKLWIKGPDGAAVPDSEIEVGCRGSDGQGSSGVQVVAGPDGSYRVEHYEDGAPSQGSSWSSSGDGLGAGARTYYVEVKSARLGKAEATYDPVKDREVTVQFGAPAIVRATIPGYAASADRERVILTLESKEEGGGGRREDQDAEISSEGTATFPPVKPGRYEVVLRLANAGPRRGRLFRSRWNATEVGRVPVTLGPGVTPVSIPLVPTADLVVTFEGDAPDLQRVGADGVPRHTRSARGEAKDHEVAYKDLPAGRYVLTSRAGVMTVDLPASGPVAFQPNGFNAYFLEVTDKGYVKELGLRTGDLVVGIDGTEFKDKQGMDAALLSAMGRESARITIQRDGARFDVTADAKKFEEDKGSFYQPWVR